MTNPHDDPGRQLLRLAAQIDQLRPALPTDSPALADLESAVECLHKAQHTIDTQPTTTADTTLPLSLAAAFSGGAAGSMYGSQAAASGKPDSYKPISKLKNFVGPNLLELPQDALQRAAAELLQRPGTTAQEAQEFWQSFYVELPASEDVDKFLVSFIGAADESFKRTQAEQRELAEKNRQYRAEQDAKFSGHQLPG